MQSAHLIESLLDQTRQILKKAEELKGYDWNELTWKEHERAWNTVECLEHLNLYGKFYLPQIESKIESSGTSPGVVFRSGYLGDYFVKSMSPRQKLNKMKTFREMNPLNRNLDQTVIDQFIDQQIKLMQLLDRSRYVNLNQVKIQTSISRFIKINLGDTFRFYITHIIRHLNQIERIQATMKNSVQAQTL